MVYFAVAGKGTVGNSPVGLVAAKASRQVEVEGLKIELTHLLQLLSQRRVLQRLGQIV
jgi:hypothetical protein